MENIIESLLNKNKITLENVKLAIAEFSDRKFGKERPYTSPLYHLKLEVQETIEDGDIMEYADCLLLLMDSFRMKYPGKHSDELLKACFDKLEICETRKWGEPDENGVFQHIKEEKEIKSDIPKIKQLNEYQTEILEHLRNVYPDLSIEIVRGDRLMANGRIVKGFIVSNSRLPIEIDLECFIQEIDIQILGKKEIK